MCGIEGDVGEVTKLWKERLKQFDQFTALIQPVIPSIQGKISSASKTWDMSDYVASRPILLKNMWIFMECSEIDIWINYSMLQRLTT